MEWGFLDWSPESERSAAHVGNRSGPVNSHSLLPSGFLYCPASLCTLPWLSWVGAVL